MLISKTITEFMKMKSYMSWRVIHPFYLFWNKAILRIDLDRYRNTKTYCYSMENKLTRLQYQELIIHYRYSNKLYSSHKQQQIERFRAILLLFLFFCYFRLNFIRKQSWTKQVVLLKLCSTLILVITIVFLFEDTNFNPLL